MINVEQYKLSLDQQLLEMLQNDDDEEFKMYFQHPDQIEEIFQTLEARNLFLISNSKDRFLFNPENSKSTKSRNSSTRSKNSSTTKRSSRRSRKSS